MCADLHVTKGDFDEDASYPEDKVCDTNLPMLLSSATNHVSTSCAGQVLKIGEFRIGMIHGHQVKYDNGSFGWCLVIHKLSTDFACMHASTQIYYAADCTFRQQGAPGLCCQANGCRHIGHWAYSRIQGTLLQRFPMTAKTAVLESPGWSISPCYVMQADCIEGRLLINPGSATGAYNSLYNEVVPSFVLMDITGKKVKSPVDGSALSSKCICVSKIAPLQPWLCPSGGTIAASGVRCAIRLASAIQATLYVYEMKDGDMAVTKIEHPDPSLES